MSLPTLSVVIVTFECRQMILDCLTCLEAEREYLDLEVVVVDNASTDGTPEALAERFGWARVIASPENNGFSWGTNRGLEVATGRHALLLNPDTRFEPGTLAACVKALEARPEVGMLGCRLVKADGRLDPACKRSLPTLSNTVSRLLLLSKLFPDHPVINRYNVAEVHEHEIGEVGALNGAFMLARDEAWRAVGPLDEDFWMYGEDLDWCARFGALGWKILYWPEVTVIHLKGGTTGSVRSPRVDFAFHRSMWIYYRKHLAAGPGILVAPAVWVAVHGRMVASISLRLVRRQVRSFRSGRQEAAQR